MNRDGIKYSDLNCWTLFKDKSDILCRECNKISTVIGAFESSSLYLWFPGKLMTKASAGTFQQYFKFCNYLKLVIRSLQSVCSMKTGDVRYIVGRSNDLAYFNLLWQFDQAVRFKIQRSAGLIDKYI